MISRRGRNPLHNQHLLKINPWSMFDGVPIGLYLKARTRAPRDDCDEAHVVVPVIWVHAKSAGVLVHTQHGFSESIHLFHRARVRWGDFLLFC